MYENQKNISNGTFDVKKRSGLRSHGVWAYELWTRTVLNITQLWMHGSWSQTLRMSKLWVYKSRVSKRLVHDVSRTVLFITMVCLLTSATVAHATMHEKDKWAWIYHGHVADFPTSTIKKSFKSGQYLFQKKSVPHFNQLMFSWNALRPKEGHFSFFVQARDAHTQKWGEWHHMLDWGADVQRSYATKSDGFAAYHHVRFEVEANRFADSFRVKAVACSGAQIELLKSVTASVANYKKFKKEVVNSALTALPSVRLKSIPKISQRALNHQHNDRMCSPTSCSMLTQFLSGELVDPIDFAQQSFDHGLQVYGSWPFNMAHAFERTNGAVSFYTQRLNSFRALHTQLLRGIPVAVSIRGPIPGGQSPYVHGHLLVVVGWDAKTGEVLCHDPAFKTDREVFTRYKIKDFLRAWEASKRLVYWAEPRNGSWV